jgi:hypothetical protein
MQEVARGAEGIDIEDATWARLRGLAQISGLEARLGFV